MSCVIVLLCLVVCWLLKCYNPALGSTIHTYIHTYIQTDIPTSLHTYICTHIPSQLFAYILTHSLTHSLTHILMYLLTYLLFNVPCISCCLRCVESKCRRLLEGGFRLGDLLITNRQRRQDCRLQVCRVWSLTVFAGVVLVIGG